MVFESVIADVLNKVLGKYVENLDHSQLKIGIWGGDVVLNDLKLRGNALDTLDLPIQLIYGSLGQLVLKIPWKNLYGEPVVAQIEDLYILVAPKQSVAYDEEKETKYALQTKKAAIQKLEEARKLELQKDAPNVDPTFTEKLTAQIVNNLQVRIANVHLRYEDSTTTGSPFAFGITLYNLEVYTTDLNWVKTYMAKQESRVYKVANLDSLSVYMNCNDKLFAKSVKDIDAIKALFRSNIANTETIPHKYNYIIGPISSLAKLQLNMNPQNDDPPFEIPKIDLSLEMEILKIGIKSTQFQDLLKLGDSMSRMQLGQPYRKYRPYNIGYRGNARIWWQFAITCILEENVRKKCHQWSWQYIKDHRDLCRTYAKHLKLLKLSKKPTATLVAACELCEERLDTFNLLLINKLVQIDIDKDVEKEQKPVQKAGWFSWFGGGTEQVEEESDNLVHKLEAAMTDEEKQKLYKAIGYNEKYVANDLPEYYEAVKMNFTLKALEIGVYDDLSQDLKAVNAEKEERVVLLMNFNMAKCEVVQRPAANAVCVKASVLEVQLTGLQQGDYKPMIITSRKQTSSMLLDVLFETNPLDKKCTQRLKAHSEPLEIIYDSETILYLTKAFARPQSVNLSGIEEAASEKMADLKERSATGMQYIVDKHAILEIDIKLKPTIIIIPKKGKYIPNESSLIVIDLGELSISSLNRQADGSVSRLHGAGHSPAEILRTIMEKSYDRFVVQLDDVQILIVNGHERWRDVIERKQLCEMHVLPQTSVIITADVCVISDDPRLPKTKVGITIPSINVNLTENRVFEALNIVTSIPLPESKEPEPTIKKTSSFLTASRLSVAKLLDQDMLKTKSPRLSEEEINSGEVIQYTSLELNFALHEFGVTLYNSTEEISDDMSPQERFRTPVEEMAPSPIDVDPVSLAAPAPVEQDIILSFKVSKIEANVAQRTYELVATAKLGAITLNQYDTFDDKNSKVLTVIDTPKSRDEREYLLTVSYTMVNKTCPEFTTKYSSTEQSITVQFAKLAITLHQEGLLKMIMIAEDIKSKLDMFDKTLEPKDRIATADDENVISKLATIVEEASPGDALKPKNAKNTRRRKVVDSIKIRLRANLDQFLVNITCRKRDIAQLKVQNFYAGVILKSSYTELTLRLKEIYVIDKNPLTIHPYILSILGDALRCQVVIYNMEETANYNSDDFKVDLDIGCVRIVFLNWFVASVLSFLNNFQAAQQAVADASAAAADAARQNAINAYENAKRLKLNIKLDAPIILLPVNSSSLDGICLDLGMLHLSNTTSEISVHDIHDTAIMDEIRLELRDVQVAKVGITPWSDTSQTSFEKHLEDGLSYTSMDDEFTYGINTHATMLSPMSFNLLVKRNLSSTWYYDQPEIDVSGHLKSIELHLHPNDFALIMSILNKNLSEGQDEFVVEQKKVVKPAQVVVDVHKPVGSYCSEVKIKNRKIPSTVKVFGDAKTVREQFKFNFQFDGVVLNLIQANNKGLGRFGMYFLSIKGKILADGTLSTSIVLCDIQIDDKRPNIKSKITKYLCRKDWKEAPVTNPGSDFSEIVRSQKNYILDLTAIIKENDTFAEVRVCGFDLIITVDFLITLAEFFSLPTEQIPDEVQNKNEVAHLTNQTVYAVSSRTSKKSSSPINVAAPEKKLNLILCIEEPDIILMESLEDFHTNAIIFNAQVRLNYRAIGSREIIKSQIDALRMYMCVFAPERREATKHFILHPCVISLQGSTPSDEGLHLSVQLTDIILNISPATIELINKALETMATHAETKTAHEKPVDYSKIWIVRQYLEKEYWFFIDQALDAMEFGGVDGVIMSHKTEKCIIDVPSITMVVETGVGYYTTPMLCFETKLSATVTNWSRNMKIKGALSLYMNYYNQTLGVWEPLIEKIETIDKSGLADYHPWELRLDLSIEPNEVIEGIDDTVEGNTTKITLQSEETLEITLSKTCIDVLQDLGQAFSYAIDSSGLTKPEVVAAFVLENDTGFDIVLNFRHGIFTLHECHMPNAKKPCDLNTSLVFQCTDANLSPDQVKDCTISPGGKAYLQTKDLAQISLPEDELYNIFVKVGGIDKEIVLPVSKSDQRYFPLYRDTNQEPWGIVSKVTSQYGTTNINIHGVVHIKNHFTAKINVYRNKHGTTDKVLVGEVDPGEVFHVPLHAIYAEYKELFFSIPGYQTSVQGIKWNDSPTDFNYHRQVQCDPIDTFEPLYINAVRRKTEVYHESTMKFTLLSAYYTIHLLPPLYLRNALPIDIKVSVAGCSVRQEEIDTAEEEVTKDEPDDKSILVREDLLDYGEKDVEPGNVLHMPTVQLTGRHKETKSYIVVRLIQYLEKDWSCTTEISERHEDYATWTFTSFDSAAKMEMDLSVRFEDRMGSLILTVYSPFWMINKTGLMLSYKTNTESIGVLYHPPEYNGPILFSFREKLFFDKKRAAIRVDNGDWSDKIPLDVAGSIGEVTCETADQIYHIGVHNHLTDNSLTKQITFIPFYIVTNKCNFPIQIQEHSRPADSWIAVDEDSCIPFWPKSKNKKVILRVEGKTTVPFDYSEVQCVLLRLPGNAVGGVNVEVQVTEGGVYITFTDYHPGDAPGLIVNHTSHPVIFREKGNLDTGVLEPSERVLFTWTDPTGDRLLLLGEAHVENDLRRDGCGPLLIQGGHSAFWVSFLDGLQRIILFTEMSSIAERAMGSSEMQKINNDVEISIHGVGLSILNNVTGIDILYLGIKSSGIIWEYKKDGKKRFKQFKLEESLRIETQYQMYLLAHQMRERKKFMIDEKYEIDFETMLYTKVTPRLIRRTFYPGLWLNMKTSPFQMQLHAKINRIQIDNQLNDCIFPVLLAPIPPPKSIAAQCELKPFVECSIVQRVVPNSTIKQFKYCSMLIQEFHLKVDVLVLTALLEMFSGELSDEEAAKLFNNNVEGIQKPLSDFVEINSAQEQKHFYDNLHLGPLKIHVSFSMAGSDISALPGILSTLIQTVGVTLTDVDDVVFKLAFFERQYGFFTQRQLVSEISSHYTGQALKQLYVFVLGLDVLGNPYGLVVGIKTGVQDLFYEPFQGAIQGPGEFAEGLVLGVKSLFGHTVGGAAGAVSKITGAMGKGLAALTFDEDYQKKRRQALQRKPANFQEGIARSGKGLVMGVVDGVSGVFTKPISGAREEGVEGFFKGLGKGAIGLVTRPTAGVVDFASGSFEAVKRATESMDEISRLRPPRFMHLDNILRPYSLSEAKGNKLLKEIEKGKYANTDAFAHCEEVIVKQEILLISNHRVIYTTKNDLFGSWTIQWTYLWNEILSVESAERGLVITLRKEGKKVLGLFSTSDGQRKIIPIPQRARRDYLATLMESLRRGT